MPNLSRTLLTASLLLASFSAEAAEIGADSVNPKVIGKNPPAKVLLNCEVRFATYLAKVATSSGGSSDIRATNSTSMNLWLKGVEPSVMQGLTDEVCKGFADHTAAAGWVAITGDALKGAKAAKKLSFEEGGGAPFLAKKQNAEYLIFTPTGQVVASPGRNEDGEPKTSDMKFNMASGALTGELGMPATVTARFIVDFVDFRTTGGFFATAQGVHASPVINGVGSAMSVGAVDPKKYTPAVISVHVDEVIVGEGELTGAVAKKESGDVLGTGFANYELTADADTYKTVSSRYLGKVEGALWERLQTEVAAASGK